MQNVTLGVHAVVGLQGAEEVTGGDVVQRVGGAAPVLRAQRIDGVAVVVGVAGFLDLHQQIIELILGVDRGGVDAQIVGDALLDVQSANILIGRVVLGGAVNRVDGQLHQVHAVQIIAEGDVVVGVGGQIAFLHVLAVHLGVGHVLGHVGEHLFTGRLEQDRELGAGGVVQIGADDVGDIAGRQLGSHDGGVAVAGGVADLELDAGQLGDLLHHGRGVEVVGHVVADVIDIGLHNDGAIRNPGVGVLLGHGRDAHENHHRCESHRKETRELLHVWFLHSLYEAMPHQRPTSVNFLLTAFVVTTRNRPTRP